MKGRLAQYASTQNADETFVVTPDTPLPVTSEGAALTTNNTTTATLGAGGTYTGTAEQTSQPDVGVSCHSSSAGTLYFDFSNDGTNWNTFPGRR